MTGDALDPLAAVRADAAALDALAAGTPLTGDPALQLLAVLRLEIDAAVTATTDPGVRRDAALLDALAGGAAVREPAVGLLASLRAAIDGVTHTPVAPAAPHVPAASPAAAAVVSLASRRRRGVLRTGVAAGSVALALSMSGVAAAAYDSHPGGSLYGLRTQTFGRTDDDPVAAEHALVRLRAQTRAAVAAPHDATVVAAARADLTHWQHLVAAEHNPQAQQSFAAAASSVVTTVAALPAPVAPVTVRSARSAGTSSGGQIIGVARTASPQATADGGASATATPAATSSAAAPVVPREPDASPGMSVTPSPTSSLSATGEPTSTDSPTGTASASSSVPASATPSNTASTEPAASTSASASARPTAAQSAVATTLRTITPTPRSSRSVKARAVKKKKPVIATIMTAQLPSSGVTQR